MKPTLLLLITIFFISCSTKTQKLSSLEKYELKGPVLQADSKTYDAVIKFGDITKGKLDHGNYYEFNKDGCITKAVNSYNDTENIIKYTFTFSYNSEGNLVSLKNIAYKNPVFTYIYNKDNQVIESKEFDDKGKLEGITKFIYNEDGLISEENKYDSSGTLNSKIKSTYNNNDKVKESKTYKGTGELDMAVSFEYNDRGELIAENVTHKYGGKYSYKLSDYDNHDNWTKKLSYADGKLSYITTRTIKYL